MKIQIALLLIALFFTLTVQARVVCRTKVVRTYLRRYSRRQRYSRLVRKVKSVRYRRPVCYNKRYLYKYRQAYRTRVRQGYNYRYRYRHYYNVRVRRGYRCRRRTRRYRNHVYYVNARKRCVKRRRAFVYRTRRVRYKSRCRRQYRQRYRIRKLVSYPTTCTKRVRYVVRVRSRRRCTKWKTVKRWKGRYRRNGSLYCKVYENVRVRYNTWCAYRRLVYKYRNQRYRCTKKRYQFFWRTRLVVRHYTCNKYRNVRYRHYYMKPYMSTCPYRRRMTRRVAYWYYYNATCTRLVTVRRWRWAFRTVRRFRMVYAIRYRTVNQWRTRAGVRHVWGRKNVWYVVRGSAYRTVYYYRRHYVRRRVCRRV